MDDGKRFEQLVSALLEYDDEKITHLYGAARDLHRKGLATEENVRKVFDHLYGDRKHLN